MGNALVHLFAGGLLAEIPSAPERVWAGTGEPNSRNEDIEMRNHP